MITPLHSTTALSPKRSVKSPATDVIATDPMNWIESSHPICACERCKAESKDGISVPVDMMSSDAPTIAPVNSASTSYGDSGIGLCGRGRRF